MKKDVEMAEHFYKKYVNKGWALPPKQKMKFTAIYWTGVDPAWLKCMPQCFEFNLE